MFGENVKRIRKEKDMTQVEVAGLAKIHKRYYQDIEWCRRTPSVVIAAKLRKALDCDWTDLTRDM